MKVEIGQYWEINKGALKARFSMHILPEGQKILDCKYFVQGESRWFCFPQKEVKKEGEKSQYIPFVSYTNKIYETELKTAVLAALKEQDGKKSTQSKDIANPQSDIQDDSPVVW